MAPELITLLDSNN